MMFPTIAWRELAVKARQEREVLRRVWLAAAAVVLVILWLAMAEVLRMPSGTGELLYKALGWIGMVLGGLEGLRHTVDSLSREKREGTLGFLFLTRVTSLDVVMGKWVVHALSSFYRLLAIFPALAVPIILGGITFGEFGRLLLCVANVLFVGLALGMLVSAWGGEENEVWVAGMAWLVLLLAGPLAAVFLTAGGKSAALDGWLTSVSPLRAWLLAPEASYRPAPAQFWSALAFSHVTGWLLLTMAAWSMAIVWKRMAQGTAPARWGGSERWLHPLVQGLRWFDRRVWRALPGFKVSSPLGKFLMNESPPALLLGVLLVAGGAGVVALPRFDGTNNWLIFFVAAFFYATHWVVRFWAAAQSCQVLRQLRESGWLFTLLAMPLQRHELPKALLQSQQPALRMVFLLLLAMELFFVMTFGVLLWPANERLVITLGMLLWPLGAAILWADLQAVHAAGLWHSLKLNQPAQATRRTIFQVLLLPLLVAPLAMTCMGVAMPIFMFIKSILFHRYYRDRLLRDFPLAIEQSQEFTHAPVTGAASRWLGLKKVPPRLPVHGRVCIACGHGVGDAAYCPFCGYRQPDTEA